ncbi:MAG: metallophosphoesterase [Candidatus Kariarchaeaceae archaeon]|jgi:CheY-like chemotaxis protein/predicted phosphodiesterase
MSSIRWLHLSDLHFKSGEDFVNYNQRIVLEKLFEDIENQINNELKPDLIFFSGDIAFHGKGEEFDLAIKYFFDPLLEITGLSKESLFVVPGNHDIDWSKLDAFTKGGMLTLLDSRNYINQFLSEEQDRAHSFRKFQGYREFINTYFENYLIFDDKDYFYTRILKFGDYKIGLLGLNSTWMSGCNNDRKGQVSDQGFLLVGERQLYQALKRTREADLRIAVLHHPIDWLHNVDRDDVEKMLESGCDIILHGHLHTPRVFYKSSNSGQAVYIPCGALYTDRVDQNGYNFVEFDLDSKQVNVYLRRYIDRGPKGSEWMQDNISTGEALNGIIKFNLRELAQKTNQIIPTSPKKILLIEDKAEWRKIIESLLIPPEFKLQIVSTYAKSVELLLQLSFDLVILNLSLQYDNDFEGVAVLDFLKQTNNNHIPCIVLTGSSIEVTGLFERYNVHKTFIKGKIKTFNKADFLRAIRKVLLMPTI